MFTRTTLLCALGALLAACSDSQPGSLAAPGSDEPGTALATPTGAAPTNGAPGPTDAPVATEAATAPGATAPAGAPTPGGDGPPSTTLPPATPGATETPAATDTPAATVEPSTPIDATDPVIPTPTGDDPGLGVREPDTGPGGPSVAFTEQELLQNCAFVDGDSSDLDHHNTVAMYDGYMVMPWAHEAGVGGVSFYDISDPCSPTRIGIGTSAEMRETHTVSISNIGGRHLFAAQKDVNVASGGLQVWDIGDVTSPEVVGTMPIPGHIYPNAYDFVTMATMPQGRYLYLAAGFLGFFVVDISNPTAPEIVANYQTTPALRAQEVIVVGNLLFSSAAEGARVLLLDISNPTQPQPIPGGDFQLQTSGGAQSNAYSGNLNGGHAYFSRQSGTGGLLVYDVSNPENPSLVGDFNDAGGNGGYAFFHGSNVFVGNSNFFSIYDRSDLSSLSPVGRLSLPGDQDTITPIGNIALLSVDSGATANQASAIAPWNTQVDRTAPAVNWVYPPSGSAGLAITSRIGVTFDEAVTYQSAWRPGAVRMYPTALGPASSIAADISVMDTIVNLVPSEPLQPQTAYTFEVVPGGVEDNMGNAVSERFTATFTTGG